MDKEEVWIIFIITVFFIAIISIVSFSISMGFWLLFYSDLLYLRVLGGISILLGILTTTVILLKFILPRLQSKLKRKRCEK